LTNVRVHTKNDNVLYGPTALLNAFSNSLTSPILNGVFAIKGIFKNGKGVSYNGIYYDILKDEFTDSSITLVVPEILRYELIEGQMIEGFAYLSKRLLTVNSRIDLILTLTSILSRKDKVINIQEVKSLELIHQKANLGYKDVDNLIKNRLYQQLQIKVAIIIGTTAIIDNDINHQLKDASTVFDIRYIKANLTKAAEIIQAMKNNDGVDVLVISRGGGENIQMFNDLEIAQQALDLKSVLITAIGHATDDPLLQKIADKHFITPTALGQYFYDIYSQTINEFNNSRAKLIADLTKQIEFNFQMKMEDVNNRLIDTTKSMQEAKKDHEVRIKNLSSSLTRARLINGILVTLLVMLTLICGLYFYLS
jgi:exodeoxyribonuclease VII large subunit